MNEAEERKIKYLESIPNLRLSPDTYVLENSDDEPEIIGEVKAKETARSEKVAESEKEESEGVAEVSVADKEEETVMDTEAIPLDGAPEIMISVSVTPMEILTTSELQPSPAILDQGSVRSLIPSILKRSLHLYYPLDSLEDLNDVEKNLRELLPHQTVAKAQSLIELIQGTDL
ncbi:MAG: hypothetical protein GY861_03540, partial [bacterium]|nr:hypothetical protein [bacterium]